jgi:hypothetical protein
MTKFRPTSAPLVVGERFQRSWFLPGKTSRSFEFSSKDQAHHFAKAADEIASRSPGSISSASAIPRRRSTRS